jgi:hypothetical protein
MADDECTKKIKAQYAVWPSARASQAVAKCRKESGQSRKSEEGASLRRWGAEKWKDVRTGEPCGAGGAAEYCRPTKIVSKTKTPTTRAPKGAVAAKVAGKRAPSTKTPRRK